MTFCTGPEVPDDFTTLKAFEAELDWPCEEDVAIHTPPRLQVEFAAGHLVGITITGRQMRCLPKAMYQFHHLRNLTLNETSFPVLPDLRAFANLNAVVITNNAFQGPVRLRNLPKSISSLTLSRDGITNLIVDASFPNLTWVDISHNRLTQITPAFCELPKLESLILSGGCCLSDAQEVDLRRRAKKILCKKDVSVQLRNSID
jgi:Leucine-rich repeat (LRR) protein